MEGNHLILEEICECGTLLIPIEIVKEIFEYCNCFDLLLFNAKVCKNWREISLCFASERCADWIGKFKLDFIENCHHRNKLITHLMRMEVYKIAIQAYSLLSTKTSLEQKHLNNIETNLEELRIYFPQFHDLKQKKINLERPKTEQEQQKSSIFSQFIPNFLLPYWNDASSEEVVPPPPIMKVILKGEAWSGKTSFFDCVVSKRPVTGVIRNSIRPDFGTLSLELGEHLNIVAQIWDEHRFNKPLQYENVFTVILMIDSLKHCNDSVSSITSPQQMINGSTMIVENFHSIVEVVTVLTKKDCHRHLESNQSLFFEKISELSFTHFGGGLAVDISNTNIDEPNIIIWYCALLNYLIQDLSSNHHDFE